MRAYDSVWIFGDEFASRSFESHYQQRDHSDYSGYVKEFFDLYGFTASKYTKHNQNLISRIVNLFIEAIQKYVLLPKLIVFVMDDDIIKFLNIKAKCPGMSRSISRIVNEIMKQFDRIILSQKDFLPRKSKKLWISTNGMD